mmetsp:Transcript_16045/g.24905  ORF Transcript_16045/g.24905 Transcript_16045/m.24905 type:complete len:105 (-) Transcript_16045:449-763(-)
MNATVKTKILYEHVPNYPGCLNDPMLNRTGDIGFNIVEGNKAARIALVNESSNIPLAGLGEFTTTSRNISDVADFGPFEMHGHFKRDDPTPFVNIFGFEWPKEI